MTELPSLPPPAELEAMFFAAARRGDVAVLAALLRAGIDVEVIDDRGYGALVLASYHGHADATALLLDAGANPDGGGAGQTPLMGVAFKGHAAIAALLLDHGAGPHARNSAGETALTLAERFGHRAVAERLLARGARPDQ